MNSFRENDERQLATHSNDSAARRSTPAGVPLVYHEDYSPPLPDRHRFPMPKFRLLFEHLQSLGILTQENWYRPQPATTEQLRLGHDAHYIKAFLDGSLPERAMRRIGLPWSEALARRTITAVGGSLLAVDLAFRHGLSAHLAGGTHHAHFDFGSGFCIFNDLAIMARYALAAGYARHVMIIDCDVHQGDGTARILSNEPQVTTCSLHCRENFPYRKANSDFDVEIPKGIDGSGYQRLMENHLHYWLSLHPPDLLLYDAGVDVHAGDALGYLNLNDDDLMRRDESVLQAAVELGIPVACVIGGGYDRDHARLARRHSLIHQTADRIYRSL